jgi:hypothetical protein
MSRLLSEPLRATRLGQANAEAARRIHAPERLVERMEQVYRQAIAAHHPKDRTMTGRDEIAYSG